MKILLIYATYSGSTQMAAQIAHDVLTEHTYEVDMKLASEITAEEIKSAEYIVLASPSWDDHGRDGMPHEDFLRLQERIGDAFAGKHIAMLGLGDNTYAHFCGCVDYIEGWMKDTKAELFVPSLRVDNFYFDTEGNTQKVKSWASDLVTHLPAA